MLGTAHIVDANPHGVHNIFIHSILQRKNDAELFAQALRGLFRERLRFDP